MSSSKYPLLAARWRAVVLCGGLFLVLVAKASAAVIGVALQQGASPASPGSSHYLAGTNSTVGYYSSIGFPNSSANVVHFSFSDLFLYGGQFFNLSALATTASKSLGGSLASIEIYVNLSDREPFDPNATGQTYASDLSVLIGPAASGSQNPDPNQLLLQLGGYSGVATNASPHPLWNEENPLDELFVSDVYSFSPTLSLVSGQDPQTGPVVWLGHGFTSGSGSNWGKWTGYVEFTFTGSGGSGVPDVSRTALLLAPGTLLLLGLAGRSRRRG